MIKKSNQRSLKLKKMGIVNLTPDSFSDGGKIKKLHDLENQIRSFGPSLDVLDVGAESTAPRNYPISSETEWDRLLPYLDVLFSYGIDVSIDTYHPETMMKVVEFYKAKNCQQNLIWNDVSGKFDEHVKNFLTLSEKFFYIFCHNLSPSRALTSFHMDYVKTQLTIAELAEYFRPYQSAQVIFDPCLGFSKSYEQNWMILHHFSELQNYFPESSWLIGFSRKSFLRKKYEHQLSLILENQRLSKLDDFHLKEFSELSLKGVVYLRTHTPQLDEIN